MSLTQKIAHNTITQMTGKIISTFLGLIAVAMMTRYLGKEQFGWYTTAITFLQFAGILIDFGLIPVTAQMMSEPRFDKTKLYQNIVTYRFITALIFFAIVPLIALFFPYPREVKIAISFTTISFLAIAMNQVFIGLFQQRLKMHFQALGEIAGRIFLVLGLWFLMYRHATFLPIMGIVVGASVVYAMVMYVFVRRETPLTFSMDREIWRAITQKMWPIAIAIMFNVVYLKGDILLLSVFASQTTVGLYGAAYRVIDIVAQIAMMVMGIMLPLLTFAWSHDNKDEFFARLQMSFDALMLFGMPIAVGLFMLATPIMTFVAGTDFVHSGDALRILAIAIVGLFFGSVFGHTVVAVNRQKPVLWVYISAAILTFAGYLIFIPRYGMYGAAWMTVFSEVYAGVFSFFHVYRYIKKGVHLYTFGKIVLSALVMGVAIYYTQQLQILMVILIAIIVYALMLLITRTISRETLREIVTLRG